MPHMWECQTSMPNTYAGTFFFVQTPQTASIPCRDIWEPQSQPRKAFLALFHSVADQQRGRTNECTQCVADHIIRLCHTQCETVLRILDPCTENTANKYRKGDPPPTVPCLRQSAGQRQSQREEEKHIHQHLPVQLRLLLCRFERSEWDKNKCVITWRTTQKCDIKNPPYGYPEKKRIDFRLLFRPKVLTEPRPSHECSQHHQADNPRIHSIDLPKHLPLPYQPMDHTKQRTVVPTLLCRFFFRRFATGRNPLVKRCLSITCPEFIITCRLLNRIEHRRIKGKCRLCGRNSL